MSISYNNPDGELYPEYAEYQKYIHFDSSSSFFNAFENAESSQQYLDAPPSQKLTSNNNTPVYNVDIAKSDYFIISPQVNLRDPVSLHFNVQTSIADSKGFNVLSYEELEDLKKSLLLVETRLGDINHKLAMEVKVYDAAVSLSKLGAGSLNGQRKSFLFNTTSKEKKRLSKQADDEIEISKLKIDSLRKECVDLLNEKNNLNTKILQHHVAILALTHPGSESSSAAIFASTNKPSALEPTPRKATSRMLSQQRSSTTLSPPQSPLFNLEEKIDKIINKLEPITSTSTSINTSTTATSQSDKLDLIYSLSDKLIDQINHSKSSLQTSQYEAENLNNTLAELLHTMDPTKKINPAQYRNPSDLKTIALRTLRQFQDEYKSNHNQLSTSNKELETQLTDLQQTNNDLKQQLDTVTAEAATATAAATAAKKSLLTSPIIKTIDESTGLDDTTTPISPESKVKSLLRQQVESLTNSYETNRTELEKLEIENVDLKTTIQETRFSSQAEIQQLKNELTGNEERIQEWKERCDALHSELESVVKSLEEVTRQAVDYESERTKLERTVHDLQNKLFQVSNTSLDRRVSMIGGLDDISSSTLKPAVTNGINSNTNEPLSVSILRHEFRRITQEMNTKHMKEIKQLQSEKKKLEHLLRSIKTSSYMGNISLEQIQSLGAIEAN